MENRHQPHDLAQMQSLSLEAKILMTKQRIKDWYESWTRFEIFDEATGKTRFETIDTRDFMAEPKMKDSEFVVSAERGQVYVSFSGGKDSTVLKHIVDSMYDDVPSLFVNTGLEYPEIQKFAMSQKNVITVRPEMRFDEVIKKCGYPVISKEVSNTVRGARRNIKEGKYSLRLRQLGIQENEYSGLYNSGKYDYEKTVAKSKFMQNKWRFLVDADFESSEECCYHTKKAPLKKYEKETGRKPLIATLACESMNREAAWMKKGCNAFDSPRPTSQPMSFWTNQDILHYIKKHDVPYCPVYGEIRIKPHDEAVEGQIDLIDYLGCYEPEDTLETTGCNRTGCIFCMFGCHLEKEPNRFQRLKETHPRQYDYCINGGQYTDFHVFDSSGSEIKLKHCTSEQIENWISANLDNKNFTIKRKWQPNKEGLGLGHVLDYIGVKY